ncbi:EAL domain-containing protein [Dokdonella sp. MW10]|uniref:EAL domain-containing protein n=1 Tax=Dokdonella sp. MW10 TaxID=2992926 RepID=UPI003F7F75BC
MSGWILRDKDTGTPGSSGVSEGDEVRRILGAGAIRAVFQPIVDLVDGRHLGMEGLSRFDTAWPEPFGGWFSAAVRCGVSQDFELACLHTITRARASVRGVNGYTSVNMSPDTLMRVDLEDHLPREHASEWVLEITEYSEVRDYKALASRVRELQHAGWRIAVDDVGAGYSTIQHVLRIEPNILKLDSSLTRDIDAQPRHRELVAAITRFASDTGVSIIAEGIETEAEKATLMQLGIRIGQGFLSGRPAELGSL